MEVRIDTSSTIPVYRQIADAIRVALVEGTLNPGGMLPPIRHLALDLGVHFNTVAESYRILAAEGWLELKRRRGATILSRKAPKGSQKREEDFFQRRLRELIAKSRAAGLDAGQIALVLRQTAEEVES